MFEGEVVAIYVGPEQGEPMQARDSVQAVAGRGLEGDRYFTKSGTFSNDKPGRAITLIEVEAVEAASKTYEVAIDASETRRNIVTRGVPLNHLVDKDFAVGEVRLHGVKLCEPCGHLERVTEKGVKEPLIHRGGLRAEILNDGTIGVGDTVRADTG